MKKVSEYFSIILGASILSFGIYNIHTQSGIAEGGELELELLLQHFFKISPGITSFVFDTIFFVIGIYILGNKFAFRSILGTATYSISYLIFECFPPVIMNLKDYPLIASLIGAVFVGIGSGLVVRQECASGGDDSLSLILSKITKLPIGICYFLFDFIIILISLTYIDFNKIIYSFITAILSSLIINIVVKTKILKE